MDGGCYSPPELDRPWKWPTGEELGVCYSQIHRNGLTLIEVVASIALLSAILVASLMGAQRHDRQLRTAKVKSIAVSGADQLLSAWHRQGRLPVGQRGVFMRDGYEFTW